MELIFTLEEIGEAASTFINTGFDHKVHALHGEMGSGKTTFVHAVCEALGVNGVVSSPTFSIINEYTSANGEIIYHIDLYRLKDEAEVIQSGVEECLFSGNTCLIEWPEKAAALLPADTLHSTITVIDMNSRKLKINL